jgi:tRNA threonylcarbamoyladenosine biosynthesis protein TsaE
VVLISSSPEETLGLGERFGRLLPPGSVVALRGGLGAGKTWFTKGIARALGVSEEVTSPSYTILSEYEGRSPSGPLPLYHFDAWRLRGDDDFAALGAEEYLYGEGVSVVEWSERVTLPEGAISVEITILEGERRRIAVSAAELPGLDSLDAGEGA